MFKFLGRGARIEAALAELNRNLQTLLKETRVATAQTDQNFANLQAQVTQSVGVEQSALVLIQGFAAALAQAITASNNGDSAALPALQQQLATSSSALAAAVAANPLPSGTGTNTSTGTSTGTATGT